jgi:dCTP deaminase
MAIIPLTTRGSQPSVLTEPANFDPNGHAVLIKGIDKTQLLPAGTDCNITYDLRIGTFYRDHRSLEGRTLQDNGSIELLPGNAVIIQTAEEVCFPRWLFGQILPKVSLLQIGLSNTPGKIDPGYSGRLLITTFNHGKRVVKMRCNDRFCSMFVSAIQGDVHLYNKPGKQIIGVTHKYRLLRFRDLLEANIGAITTILIIVTALNTLALFFR